MIHFKNRNGFLLLEAMFATFIVGMMIAPLFISQNSTLRYLASGFSQITRIMSAKNFLYQSVTDAKKFTDPLTLTKKEDEPPTQLSFTYAPLAASSSLASFSSLMSASVRYEWEQDNRNYSESIGSILFVSVPEEKK